MGIISQICALLTPKPTANVRVVVDTAPVAKKRPALRKATTKPVAKKAPAKKVVAKKVAKKTVKKK
jgi:hypothetical protein